MKMSLILKKALTAIGGAALVVSVCTTLTGCDNFTKVPYTDETINVTESSVVNILENGHFVVIDGVLHYGNVEARAYELGNSSNRWAVSLTPEIKLEDGTEIFTYNYQEFDKKPSKVWYNEVCEDCFEGHYEFN